MSMPDLIIRILGSGTSMGIPVVGCRCPVCLSDDPFNKRLRSSISIQANQQWLLVDCSIDFRTQLLKWPMPRIDAVLLTHAHSDHILGIDDLRAYNFLQQAPIPFYSSGATLTELQERFPYCFYSPVQIGGGIPQLDLHPILPGKLFTINDLPILPIPIMHGKLPILGFRIGDFAYLTDCSGIPESSMGMLHGVRILIISALRHTPHPTHFCLADSLEAAKQLHVEHVYFTHVSDDLDYQETNRELPSWAKLLYDGQELTVTAER